MADEMEEDLFADL